MASSLSLENIPDGLPEGASDFGGQDRGTPSSLNLNFFKTLADKRATRDGNPPKRRGPKPDSKPALTRRQELNRQAQRTHRERKELYIKALEDEVLRLKELYSSISQEKNKLAEVNKQLRDALAQHGVSFVGGAGQGQDDMFSNPSMSNASGTSPGASLAAGSLTSFSPAQSTALSVASAGYAGNFQPMTGDQMPTTAQASSNGKGVDCEQAGIDFVLALEKPCMQHMPFLLERAADADGEPCGHALMASCPTPPLANPSAKTPLVKTETQDPGGGTAPQGTLGLNKADLATLLNLSKKLDLDGEITPVMAWGMIVGHPRWTELRSDDFKRLAEELSQKVRCYGFGAVLEEFELRDAFERILPILPCDLETMVY